MLVADFDNDGWPDIYVANDSTSSALYKNNHDGTFTDIAIEAGVAYSPDGKPQAGMGVSAADYDLRRQTRHRQNELRRRHLQPVSQPGQHDSSKTRPSRPASAESRASSAGASASSTSITTAGRDILVCNGHVYPEVADTDAEAGYRERKVLYRNLGNGKFADVSHGRGAGHSGTSRRPRLRLRRLQ